MTGFCFYFEDNNVDVYSGRLLDFDMWNLALKTTGDLTKIALVNESGVMITNPDEERFTFTTPGRLFRPANAAVLVTPWEADRRTAVELWDFNHLVDWYLFGPAQGWAGDIPPGQQIYIPQANLDQRAALHSVHIATVVAMHRFHVIGA